jgi:hypothetical protein|tara:strand:+ start:117 stop:1361 length:1245 start_codon:yes stop_codon:yes gene_type:complete
MEWDKIPNIQWYGERGIVNAVVTYINKDKDPKVRVERLKDFLEAIVWGGGNEEGPVALYGISDFRIVVELGLSEFGNPDLIIVCKDKVEKSYCIFIEAKVGPYQKSMQSNKEGMEEKGFNSSINGQLSLKYRFAKALKLWNRDPNNGLEEPKKIYDEYKEVLKDKHRGKPRKIKKPGIIEKILEPLGLKELDDERFYFVAWTWDDDDHIFFNDPEVEKNNGMPLFCDLDEDERKKHLGWLGYKKLEECLYKSLEKSPDSNGSEEYKEYKAAREIMIDSDKPNRDNNSYTAETIGQSNFDCFDDEIKDLSDKISELFEDPKAERLHGSYSVSYGNKVVAKIIPQKESVFVGFLINIVDAISDCYELKVIRSLPHKVLFKGIEIALKDHKEFDENVKEFISECLNHIEDTWYMNDA